MELHRKIYGKILQSSNKPNSRSASSSSSSSSRGRRVIPRPVQAPNIEVMDLQVEPELEESKQEEFRLKFEIHVIADHTNEAATTTILKKKQPVWIPASSFEIEEQKHEREASKQAIEYRKVDHKY